MSSAHHTPRTPLRGRDDQLAKANAVLAATTSDGQSGVLIVRGRAGAGKSRLVDAVIDAAVDRGFAVLHGTGDVDATTMPLAPLLEAVLRGPEPLMDRAVIQEAMQNDDARYLVIEHMTESLEKAARAQPLLIAIDDLEFCDTTTLFALRMMIDRLAGEALVWVIAIRDPVRDDAVARTLDRVEPLNAHTLHASRLSLPAARQVAEDVLAAQLDDNLSDIVARADGEVLDLVEALRGLVDEGRVQYFDGRAVLDDTSVPMRLRDSVARRLDHLPLPAVEALAAASVVGRKVSPEIVAALLERSVGEIRAVLRVAENQQLVVAVDGGYEFGHDLIREAIELTLPDAVRRDLRRRAVDTQLAAGTPILEVATALADTANIGDTQAANLLEQAADDVAGFDPSAAADLLARAADIMSNTGSPREHLLAQQVMLLWQAGRTREAQQIGEQILVAGLGPISEAEVRLGLARVASEHSYVEAGRQAAAALSLAGLPDALRAQLVAAHAIARIMVGDFDNLGRDIATGLALARTSADRLSEASLLSTNSTLLFYQMDWRAAFDTATQVLHIADGISTETSIWSPKTLWLALMWSTTGYPDEALRITDHEIADAAAARQGAAISLWMMTRARALLEAGRLADAQAEAEAVLSMTDWRERSSLADYTVNFVLRRVAQYTGDPEALRRSQTSAAQMARDAATSVRRQGKWLAAIDADIDGHPDLAIDLTAEGVDAYEELGQSFSMDPADEPLFARIASRAGRPDLAARAAEHAEARAARNPQFLLPVALARHTRGLVDDDADALLEAVELFSDTQRPLPHAAALEDAGRVNPHRDTAVELLDHAHSLYAEAGALRDAARTRQRLRSLGVRRKQPRGETTNSPAELTRSELAVAELVARGGTNREVAAQLFLSPHTVNTHLRRAFTKLGVRSRVELARHAAFNEHLLP